jgi:hypothetical protein
MAPDEAENNGFDGTTTKDDNERMARFAPQPFGLGPIFPISLSLITRVHGVRVAPRFANWEKLGPSAAPAKVNDRLYDRFKRDPPPRRLCASGDIKS